MRRTLHAVVYCAALRQAIVALFAHSISTLAPAPSQFGDFLEGAECGDAEVAEAAETEFHQALRGLGYPPRAEAIVLLSRFDDGLSVECVPELARACIASLPEESRAWGKLGGKLELRTSEPLLLLLTPRVFELAFVNCVRAVLAFAIEREGLWPTTSSSSSSSLVEHLTAALATPYAAGVGAPTNVVHVACHLEPAEPAEPMGSPREANSSEGGGFGPRQAVLASPV